MTPRLSHLFILGLLWLALAGCSPFQNSDVTPTPLPTLASAARPTYTVKRGEILTQIEFSGRVAPAVEQSLSFRQGGTVGKIRVEANMDVKQNELLAELAGANPYEIRRAQINVEMAKINLEMAKVQPASQEKDLEVQLKEREVELAQLALDQLTGVITDTQIIAPFAGKVTAVRISEGKSVQAFDSAIILADMSHLSIKGDPSGNDLKKLNEGMAVQVVLDKRPNETLPGHIEILPFPYGSGSGTQGGDDSTRVVLDSSEEQAKLENGQSADIKIVLAHKTNVLWIPPAALRTFQGRQFVIVQSDSGQRRVDIKLGLQNEDQVEIVDGLSEGQVVVGP